MRLQDILEVPVTKEPNRHPYILNQVLEMMDRGDSKETIHQVVNLLTSYECMSEDKKAQ